MRKKLIDDVTGYTFTWQEAKTNPGLSMAIARKFNHELPRLSHTQANAIFKQMLGFYVNSVVLEQ
jgi:hypothetical protein